MTSEYRTELTYELRHRGLDERAVADIVAELPDQPDTELENEFGSAKSYALSFASGSKKPLGSKIIMAAVVISVFVIGWRVVSVWFLGAEQSVILSAGTLVGAVLVVAIASVVAAAVDRRTSAAPHRRVTR